MVFGRNYCTSSSVSFFNGLNTLQDFSLKEGAPEAHEVKRLQQRGNIRKADFVLRVPLKHRSTKSHPTNVSFPQLCQFWSFRTSQEIVDPTLAEIGLHTCAEMQIFKASLSSDFDMKAPVPEFFSQKATKSFKSPERSNFASILKKNSLKIF